MSGMPAYFEAIRRKAAGQWDRLEEDPELAGPWHQLFKQVQSPRHILSELLQNADDAGATEASVRIIDQAFIFEHNGEDFAEEHLASLCRFGYSNKRALHTIGFRGIGFKSTFSLGDRVQLFTPSLSICFHRRRFTEPEWIPSTSATNGRTRIQVDISDRHRQREVEKNLEEWIRTPISLLFFKNLRRMRIAERDIHWGSLGPGPVPESEWMALYENQDEAFLLLRSPAEEFPDDALAEIREERMLGIEEAGEFPPCKVEIVLGGSGRLYVVLPTGVETELPFACNAPFIQDPARLKIKDPETSPTNRWLLERAGQLAASAMTHWLGQTEASLVERASAYGLLPDVDREDASLEGVCGTIVEEAFSDAIDGESLLLTEDGRLAPADQSIIIPTQVLDVWAPEQAALLLDDQGRPPLSQHVDATDRTKLLRWGLIDEIDKQSLLVILRQKHLPKPETWRQLLTLWGYVAPEITGYRRYVSAKDLRILPVQGKDVLYSAGEVVRLGEKKLLQSEDDWEFLARYLVVLNQNWPRFLAEQRRVAAEGKRAIGSEDVETAYAILREVGLDDTSDVNKVIEQVAAEFFSQPGIAIAGCVQLAQIAAKLGASAGEAFRYATRDRHLRAISQNVLVDEEGKLEDLLPAAQQQARLLHSEYLRAYQSCSREDWLQGVASGKSGLATFPPLVEVRTFSGRRRKLDEELQRRAFTGQIEPRYKDPWFSIYDWDFEPSIWNHWEKLAVDDPSVWASVTDLLFAEKPEFWSQKTSARIVEQASNGHDRTFLRRDLTPRWALRLRELPCLPDTRGIYRKPDDLLRRTPETESLMDVEPFVHGRLDREVMRPLLDLLGVRSTPTGPDRLLDCLRALSKAQNAPAHEVEKWYRRLDQMVDACSTADFQKIRQALRSERLVLTHDGEWVTASAVFLSSDDEDVPDAALIRPSVSDLMLWRKIGIAERPTADLAIEWMKGLPSGKALSQEDARRVRALLVRHPFRIWDECRHWLSLAGEWAHVDSLCYGLTMQSLIPWRHLHPWVKQQTADFQRLPGEALVNPPFSGVPSLSTRIEDRLLKIPPAAGQAVQKDWLRTLGAGLRRVELEGEEETSRVRAVAERLSRTRWTEASKVEIIPYINGTPAGTPRQADVVWLDEDLYVEPLPKAKLARRVPEEIGKAFARADIKAALDYSFERSAQDVREYLEENFSLSPVAAPPAEPADVAENAEGAGNGGDANTDVQMAPASAEEHEDIPAEQDPDASEVALQADQEVSPETAIDTSTDESEDVQQTGADVEPPAARPRPVPKPTIPSIIERFAQAEGFRKDGEQRFFHENGSWIGRAAGAPFPWEFRAANGELVRCYWPKDHCLEREPLQLEADVWGLIEQHPATYALILTDLEGDPVEVTGARLRALRDQGEVTLYPAAYRLVFDRDRHV
jgi:hypothetical protein